MRKFILISIVLLAVLPAAALDNVPTNATVCFCRCDPKNRQKQPGYPLWEKDKAAACSASNGKNCNAQQPNGSFEPGTLASCNSCKTNGSGECLPGTIAIGGSSGTIPVNATFLPAPPWKLAKPLTTAGTAQPVAPAR